MATVRRWTGREARALRQALRQSVRVFAEHLGVAARTVSKWEAGGAHTCPRPDYQAILDTALGQADRAAQERFALLTEDERQHTDFDASVTRSLQSPAGFAEQLSAAFPVLNLDDLQHLTAAMSDSGRYLDAKMVGHFEQQLMSCADDDGSRGPQRTLPAVLGVVGVVEQHARRVKPAIRRQLLAVGARGAEFAGWLYRDVYRPDLATFWRDRAVEWSQEAGDWPMQGYILLKKSQSAWDERDGLRMLTLAQATQTGPWTLPPLVKAEAAQQEARGLAMVSEPRAAVARKLDEAWELFNAAGAADRDADQLGRHYSHDLLKLQTAICHCEAGEPIRAVDLYSAWLAEDRFSYRDRGYFLSLMAGAQAQAGEPDDAAETAHDALAVAVETSSQRTVRELARVCALLEPWQGRPSVRDLRGAVLA